MTKIAENQNVHQNNRHCDLKYNFGSKFLVTNVLGKKNNFMTSTISNFRGKLFQALTRCDQSIDIDTAICLWVACWVSISPVGIFRFSMGIHPFVCAKTPFLVGQYFCTNLLFFQARSFISF